MKRSLAILLPGLVLALASAGCSGHARRGACNGGPYKHLIFNPNWIQSVSADTARRDWPSTIVYEQAGERIEYRETIIDRQGRFGLRDDFHYRRFDSTRTGRARR